MATPRKPPWERRSARVLLSLQPSLLASVKAAAGSRGLQKFIRGAIRARLARNNNKAR